MEIAVVGSGGWGTALSLLLHNNGHDVTAWSYSLSELDQILTNRENPLLRGVHIPEDIAFSSDLSCVRGKKLVISAVPSFAVRATAQAMAPLLAPDAVVVSVTKGIEQSTSMRMSEILAEVTGCTVAALSGPTHAEEVGRGIPTGCVVACQERWAAEFVQDIFISDVFRVYSSPDIIGIELAAALKNIYALIAGVLEGVGCGDNTKALMMTRSLTESARLGLAMGAKKETFAGLAGVGDLIVTCCSMHSRNHRCGILIGQGVPPKEAMAQIGAVVEGYYAAASAMELSKKAGVEMPIAEQAYKAFYGSLTVQEAIATLMGRERKHEIEESWI